MRALIVSMCRALVVVAVLTPPAAAATATRSAKPPASVGSDTSIVHIGSAEGGTRAFVARPAVLNNAPVIVVIHEWWGLNDQIRQIARRLAREGYFAIVPDLYHGKVATDPEMAHELSRGLDGEVPFKDLDSAINWIRQQPGLQKSRLGVVGFCVGGGLSERLALRRTDLSAAVMFYGSPVTDPEELKKLSGPLLAHFGATDQGIPPSRAEELRQGLKDSGMRGDVYVYPGAGHAFMNETRPSYHADAARQAWSRTLAFFQQYLKG